jgi:hypothetical protein
MCVPSGAFIIQIEGGRVVGSSALFSTYRSCGRFAKDFASIGLGTCTVMSIEILSDVEIYF